MQNNFAFIDAQNVYQSIKHSGWILDWQKFYVYLKEKFEIKKTYVFLGYLPQNKGLYRLLKRIGYKIILKEVVTINGKPKANVDGEMILQAMIDFYTYDKAILVTNDGDFACLVRYLKNQNKLLTIISPDFKYCSLLLRKAFRKERIFSLTDLRYKLETKK